MQLTVNKYQKADGHGEKTQKASKDRLAFNLTINLYPDHHEGLIKKYPVGTPARAKFEKMVIKEYIESLHISFSRVVDDGLFKGFQLHGSVNISHLFYADDAMFIGEWSEQNLHNIVKVLNCFHLASGLKINIAKSQVLGVGVSQNVVVQAANRIGCAVLNTPFRYLGVTVGSVMSRSRLVSKGVLNDYGIYPDDQHVFLSIDWLGFSRKHFVVEGIWIGRILFFPRIGMLVLIPTTSSRLKSILEGGFYVACGRIWRARNHWIYEASPPNSFKEYDF
ncbi:hypothetical protein Tco_1554857 [Tanacetum coccineum]